MTDVDRQVKEIKEQWDEEDENNLPRVPEHLQK